MRNSSPISILLLAVVALFFAVTDARTLVRAFAPPDCCAGCEEEKADDCCTPDGACASGCLFCACPGRCLPVLAASDACPALNATALLPASDTHPVLSRIIDIPPHPPRFA